MSDMLVDNLLSAESTTAGDMLAEPVVTTVESDGAPTEPPKTEPKKKAGRGRKRATEEPISDTEGTETKKEEPKPKRAKANKTTKDSNNEEKQTKEKKTTKKNKKQEEEAEQEEKPKRGRAKKSTTGAVEKQSVASSSSDEQPTIEVPTLDEMEANPTEEEDAPELSDTEETVTGSHVKPPTKSKKSSETSKDLHSFDGTVRVEMFAQAIERSEGSLFQLCLNKSNGLHHVKKLKDIINADTKYIVVNEDNKTFIRFYGQNSLKNCFILGQIQTDSIEPFNGLGDAPYERSIDIVNFINMLSLVIKDGSSPVLLDHHDEKLDFRSGLNDVYELDSSTTFTADTTNQSEESNTGVSMFNNISEFEFRYKIRLPALMLKEFTSYASKNNVGNIMIDVHESTVHKDAVIVEIYYELANSCCIRIAAKKETDGKSGCYLLNCSAEGLNKQHVVKSHKDPSKKGNKIFDISLSVKMFHSIIDSINTNRNAELYLDLIPDENAEAKDNRLLKIVDNITPESYYSYYCLGNIE